MADRSLMRMDRDVRLMRQRGGVPDRGADESFRTYFRRIAPTWIGRHGATNRALAESVQRLLEREARRHLPSGGSGV